MSSWKITVEKNFTCSAPVFIEGLPGIGNVGKVAIDYIVEKLAAKKVASYFSHSLPNSVFVNEDNLVQLPVIELYYVEKKGQSFLFLTGDTQPAQEEESYVFTKEVLSFLAKYDVKELVTTGGIGLDQVENEPVLYVTGNNKSFVQTFSDLGASNNIYGVVGPIVGVSGLLLGLSKQPAAALLVETFAHPMHVGLHEARVVIDLLNKKYDLGVSLEELDEEITQLTEEEPEPQKKSKFAKPTTNYIG